MPSKNTIPKVLLSLASSLAFTVHAGPSLPITPQEIPDFPKFTDLWIDGGDFSSGNLQRKEDASLFSQSCAYYLSTEAPQGGYGLVTYNFELPAAQRFNLYAALGLQGVPYVSPVEYRLDDGEWTLIEPSTEGRKPYGISNALGWENLGIHTLSAGQHTLSFRFDTPSQLGTYSFMADGIAGFADQAFPFIISKTTPPAISSHIQPGQPFTVNVEATRPVIAEISFRHSNNDLIESKIIPVTTGKHELDYTLPVTLGSGVYSLNISPVGSPNNSFRIANFSIQPEKTPTPSITLLNAIQNGDAIVCSVAAPVAGGLVVRGFHDDKLYYVQTVPVAENETSVTIKLDTEIQRMLENLGGSLEILPATGTGNAVISFTGKTNSESGSLPKPLNYGTFTDRDSINHAWYINRDGEYIFGTEPYIPFGAMWCPATTILPARSTPEDVKNAFQQDKAVFDNVMRYGLTDCYLNLTIAAPWIKQFMVDELEKRNFHYGFQITSSQGASLPAFFLTSDRADAPANWISSIKGVFQDGKIETLLPKNIVVNGLVVIAADPSQQNFVRFYDFTDTEGKEQRHHIIDLEVNQDFGNNRKIAVNASDIPLKNGDALLLLPLITSNMHHCNLWDPEEMAKFKDNFTRQLSHIQWGPGLRCFIDPVCNETNMVNATENLRQYTPHLNAAFAIWLQEKYQNDVEKLAESWAAPGLNDFDLASKLVPISSGQTLLLIDPFGDAIFKVDRERSRSYLDFSEMIRETYSDRMDEIALHIKSIVNVPVVEKSVGVIAEKMNISQTYNGMDGVGFEIYRSGGDDPGEVSGGAARGEADLSSHTVWKVGTEIGHSFNVGNDGVKFFTEEAEIRDTTEKLMRLGVRGFYYFGWALKPDNMWNNHNYHDFDKGLEWVAKIKKEYSSKDFYVVPGPQYYVFPGGRTWWWWTTRNFAVYGKEACRFPQGARLDTDSNDWYIATTTMPTTFDGILLNCEEPPFSLHYAEDLSYAVTQKDAPVYYVGFRRDLGTVPELDQYFTDEFITFPDGSMAQVLKAEKGAETLAEENGKPWAIRNGNLVIASRLPEKMPEKDATSLLQYLKMVLQK